MEMHALIEEITALLAKIKSGEATMNELEAFAAAANQLNERAIILRYKAIESKVYGRSGTAPVSETPTAVKEEIVPIIEAQEVHPEPEEEPSYDLFGMDTEEETPLTKTEIVSDKDTESKEEEIPFELIEDQVEEEPVDEEPIQPFVERVSEIEKEEEKAPVIPEPAFAAPIENTQGLHPIYGKLNSNDGTLAARLMSVRLETLKGAFGFNERLQIIQELFNGSNEEFNSLIDQIENISSKDQARSLVSSYANKYHWDADSQLAIELVQKVERKYA
ncbi:hypothetical protein [uncultured Fluviicola sp.]|uniref:hypothetical protein n=1 Tax=uncultured Fluviicola sp. TaxID=463303 RepID=UPI0025DEE664|nr:hypothetical protein [uncultured Fluviicola sp.]